MWMQLSSVWIFHKMSETINEDITKKGWTKRSSLASDPTQDEHHLAWDDSKKNQKQQPLPQWKNMSSPKFHLATFTNI